MSSAEKTCEDNTGGLFIRMPAPKGAEYGIVLENKTSRSGASYQLMKFPPKVQKMIVKRLIGENPK